MSVSSQDFVADFAGYFPYFAGAKSCAGSCRYAILRQDLLHDFAGRFT
jgi:hypothetical protein